MSTASLALASAPVSLGETLHQRLQLKKLEDQLWDLKTAVVCGLNQLVDMKDLNTGVHSTRLAEWSVRIAHDLGLDRAYQLDVEYAALLHDLGKIGIPDVILQKAGPLTAEERAIMNKHSELGWSILRMFPGFERISLFVLHHHERVDGTGYPAGLKGEEIPLGSRIVCLMDAFDAMITSRCYRDGLPLEAVLDRLEKGRGTQFDTMILDRFLPIVCHELPEVSRIAEPVPTPYDSSAHAVVQRPRP